MKNILIPTDFSENAWNATKYALHLFEQEECTFHFLHTYTPTAYGYNLNTGAGVISTEALSTENDMIYKASQNGLKKVVERINHEYPNEKHIYNVISAYNVLTDEINLQIKVRNIQLIIMGTKGATGGLDVLMGTNTLHVMRTSGCPVLTIPDTFHFKYIDNILFPSDYKYPYAKNEVYPVVALARLNEAMVHTLHISEEAELSKQQVRNRDTINAFFARIKHDFDEVPEARIPKAIEEYIDKNGIGLLAMTRREHSFFERLFFKRNLSKIRMHIKTPILVLPIK